MAIVVGLPLHFIFWYLTMVNIATPSFIGKPENRVALVDARNVRLPTIETVLAPKVGEFLSGIGLSIKNAQSMSSGIGEGLLSGRLNVDQAEERLKSVLGSGRVDYDKIKDFIKPMILQEITGYNISTGAMVNSDNYKDQFEVRSPDGLLSSSNMNFGYVKGVLNIARDVLGNDAQMEVVDTGTKTATLIGVLNGLGGLGSTQFIPGIIEKLDRNMAFNVIKGSSTSIIDNADLSTILGLGQYADLNALTINTPDAAGRLLAGYKIPDGMTPDKYPEEAGRFKQVLGGLKPDWLKVVRNNQDVFNYETLGRASSDAIEVLSRDPEIGGAVVSAPQYKPAPVKDKIRDDYPLVAINDPSVLNKVPNPKPVGSDGQKKVEYLQSSGSGNTKTPNTKPAADSSKKDDYLNSSGAYKPATSKPGSDSSKRDDYLTGSGQMKPAVTKPSDSSKKESFQSGGDGMKATTGKPPVDSSKRDSYQSGGGIKPPSQYKPLP